MGERAAPPKAPVPDAARSKPLQGLAYKDLQNICMGFNLPANLKHSQMLAMLQARYAGDEPTVHRILTEYREQRCRRRPKSDTPLEAHPETTEHKAKRRRSVTASWQEDYCRVFPQVMEATATRRDGSAPELTLHRTQPLLFSLLQERPGPSHSAPETLCGMTTICGPHPTRPPMQVDFQTRDRYLAAATPTSQAGLLSPLLFDPAGDCSHIHALNQPGAYEPMDEAEDLSVRRRTVIQSPAFPSPCQFQAPQLFLAERGGSQFSHLGICSDVTPHGHEIQAEELTKHCNKELPAALELVLNVKSDCFGTETPMPKFLKAATTSLHQCYIAPVCSTSVAAETSEKEGQVAEPDLLGAPDDPWWGPQQAPSFPEFRHNNQLSYPLIYSYLASTEDQLRQQNEERIGNANSDWAPSIQHRPQAMSSPNETSHVMDSNNFLPTASEEPQLDSAVLDIIQGQRNLHLSDVGICRYQAHGCRKARLKQTDLQQHEKLCAFQTVECYNRCVWRGHLKHLATHLRQAHGHEILRKAEASHTIPLHEVRALQKMSFLREVKRRLFVVSVHCHGHLLYAAVQSVPSWKRDEVSLVKASLEVVGHDGRPHAWRGKVRPVYETPSTLWATDQCLAVDPAAIGAFAGANIILHTKITAYVPGSGK